MTIWKQFKDNFVAFLSLLIAVIALLYTGWRETETEKNRNYRLASIEVLKNLGELQIVVNNAYYAKSMTDPFLGWGHIALINDLSQLLPPPIPEQNQKLMEAWNNQWKDLKTDEQAVQSISTEIDHSRDAVLDLMKKLK